MSKAEGIQSQQAHATQDSAVKQADRLLAQKAKAGDLRAREELILNHLPLIDTLMGPFMGKGVPEDVLYQEGCYGLILAVDRFDPDKDVLLDTYASYYVNKYLHRALVENYPHPVVLKAKSSRQAMSLRDAMDDLAMMTGRSPSIPELAEYIGLSKETTLSLLLSTLPAFDLDATDSGDWLGDNLQSRGAEDAVLNKLNELCLDDFPNPLTRRERQVLTYFFGFSPADRPHTFAEIAKLFGLSFDTISSDYHNAIQKLQDAARPKRNAAAHPRFTPTDLKPIS